MVPVPSRSDVGIGRLPNGIGPLLGSTVRYYRRRGCSGEGPADVDGLPVALAARGWGHSVQGAEPTKLNKN